MGNAIVGYKLKFNGVEKRRFEGEVVDGAPRGWTAILHDTVRHTSWKDGAPTFTSRYFVYFLNPDVPCAVSHYFDQDFRLLESQADACMPPVFSDGEVQFVDLDMDLIVAPAGGYFARDFDDFRSHVVELAYTPEAIGNAWNGLLWARQCVEARVFPFDGTAARILQACLGREPEDPRSA